MTKKGMNDAASKNTLIKTLENGFKRMEADRWLDSEEGKQYLLNETIKKANAEARQQFSIGQLVWREDVVKGPDISGEPELLNRCGKIVAIDEDNVEVEMIYAIKNDVKSDSYTGFGGDVYSKGDLFYYSFYMLEKHVAKKSGNVWWRVKI